MNLETLRTKYRDDILRIAEKYGVTNVRVFGSVARGDSGPDSDVDLLVTLTRSLGFAYGGLEVELSETLGMPVQVLADDGINPLIHDNIINGATSL